jgi:hypothetical protein
LRADRLVKIRLYNMHRPRAALFFGAVGRRAVRRRKRPGVSLTISRNWRYIAAFKYIKIGSLVPNRSCVYIFFHVSRYLCWKRIPRLPLNMTNLPASRPRTLWFGNYSPITPAVISSGASRADSAQNNSNKTLPLCACYELDPWSVYEPRAHVPGRQVTLAQH